MNGTNYPFATYVIFECVDTNEYASLKKADLDTLRFLMSFGIIELAPDAKLRNMLFDVFKSCPITTAALNNLTK